ncbi:MAG: PTS-dependent dihydroxyacetone kinase phosphotransferase subunit DhaM [Geminicoccaceae bacterium]|nr:PTS-dependent dihydroxyacetone kinase phosphotransferase subunit DhaM [Geminicoccaceae bacterium]
MSIGIVIVSHSPLVAAGARDMVLQMVGDDLRVSATGGDPGGGLGTDPGAILAAIKEVWSDEGVAIFVDMGAAEMNSEMAIEMLEPGRGSRVRIVDAPVVEGAVIGATMASTGASLEAVITETTRRFSSTGTVDIVRETEPENDRWIRRTVTITHRVGLHARPAMAFTRLAQTFAAEIRVAGIPDDDPGKAATPADAKSIVRIMGLKLKTGARIEIAATGEDAREAVTALAGFVERDFDEGGHE